MAYGKIKTDALIHDNSGSDVEVSIADLAAKASVASPTFTGTPAAPTAASGTNTTQISTTAFVADAVSGKANTSDIGTTIQAFDADTAKTDVVQTFTNAQRGQVTTVASAATITLNFNDSNNYEIDLGHTATIANPLNCTAGQSGSIFITQDATGSRVVSWGSYWDFAGGVAPVLSTAALSTDRIDYVVHSATSIHAVATLALS